MEGAVGQGVHLQVGHAVGGIAGAGQHVVPLENLVEDDAVKEAAKAQAEQNAGPQQLAIAHVGGSCLGVASAASACYLHGQGRPFLS